MALPLLLLGETYAFAKVNGRAAVYAENAA